MESGLKKAGTAVILGSHRTRSYTSTLIAYSLSEKSREHRQSLVKTWEIVSPKAFAITSRVGRQTFFLPRSMSEM